MVGDLELTLSVLGSLSLSSLDLIHLQVHQVKSELQPFPSTEPQSNQYFQGKRNSSEEIAVSQ